MIKQLKKIMTYNICQFFYIQVALKFECIDAFHMDYVKGNWFCVKLTWKLEGLRLA